MRIVCLSDTHGRHRDLRVPDGDLLLHAGDLTRRGEKEEIQAVNAWLAGLPHPAKVVIAGNHDFAFERDPEARTWLTAATYLQDEEVTVGGLRIWGSPWQPRFFDWAFNADRGEELRRIWARIPQGIDVLLTHGPPLGVLDRTVHGEEVGCADLADAVRRVRPRLHVFGHIHEGAGRHDSGGVISVNAASLDVRYRPVNPPIVVDL